MAGEIPSTEAVQVSESEDMNALSPIKVQSLPNSSKKRKGSKLFPFPLKKSKSVVWKEMQRVKDEEGKIWAICEHCKALLTAPPNNGTRHLQNHLTRHLQNHLLSCKKYKSGDVRQQLIQIGEKRKDGQQEYRNFVFDQVKSREELASMIIIHEYPLSIVDHVGFRRFVNSLQPMFKMVSRNTIRSDIMKIYDNEKAKQCKLFDDLQSRVAITSDMWSSKTTKRGFMVVTAHFLDEEWALQSRILRFIYVPSPHKKEIIREALFQCLLEWNIEKKLSTVTLDNCRTNDSMIDELVDKLETNSLLVEGEVLHMRCCAHILNLIVKMGLEVIAKSIERIRDSVVFWTASQSRIEKFEESVKYLKISCTKTLCLDVKTRWNSTYLMLQTAIFYKDVFPRLKQREKLYTDVPSEKDWELAREICDKLKVFYNVTELFSGTKYPTANIYFPMICEIRLNISEWMRNSNKVIKDMASQMMVKYSDYWNDIHVVMAMAAVLDPQYKLVLVEFYFNQVYGDEASSAIRKVRESCSRLLSDYQRKLGLEENDFGVQEPNSCVINEESDPLCNFDAFVQTQGLTKGKTKLNELDRYLEEELLPRSSTFDVLGWWKMNGIKYPTLRLIARDILAIPVSTVASESTFSTSGRVLAPYRSRLRPNTLEALICSQNWLSKDPTGPYSNTSSSCSSKLLDEEYDDGELICD